MHEHNYNSASCKSDHPDLQNTEINIEEGKEYSLEDIKNMDLDPEIMEDGTKMYKCLFCPKKYKQKNGTQQHMVSVHTNHRYKCDSCGKKFRHAQALKVHITVEHEQASNNVASKELEDDMFEMNIEPGTSRALPRRNCKPKKFHDSSSDESQTDTEEEDESDFDDDLKSMELDSAQNYIEIPCESDPIQIEIPKEDENPTSIVGSIKLDSMELDSPNTITNYINLSELPMVPCGSDLEELEMIKTVEKLTNIVATINVDSMELDFENSLNSLTNHSNFSEECEVDLDLEVQNIFASNIVDTKDLASSSGLNSLSIESIVALALQNLPGLKGTTLEVFHWINKEFYEYNFSISTTYQVNCQIFTLRKF